jgi:hypothetical protein
MMASMGWGTGELREELARRRGLGWLKGIAH